MGYEAVVPIFDFSLLFLISILRFPSLFILGSSEFFTRRKLS